MLNFGDSNGETESTTVAAQDQVTSKNIEKQRFCKKQLTVNGGYVDSVEKYWPPNLRMPHLGEELVFNGMQQNWSPFTSLIIQSTRYRTDRQMARIHTRTHTHAHKPVCEHEDATMLWNQRIHTGREVNWNICWNTVNCLLDHQDIQSYIIRLVCDWVTSGLLSTEFDRWHYYQMAQTWTQVPLWPEFKLIVCLCLTTLTEVFPCFFLSCKVNARVKPAKTGHGPHSS